MMFPKSINFDLPFLLLCITIVTCKELTIKSRNKFQPLVIDKTMVTFEPDSDYNFTVSVPISVDDETIKFVSNQSTLISACPSKREIPNFSSTLDENENIETECWKTFKPAINVKVTSKETPGYDVYSTGYWLHWFNYEGKYSQERKFVEILDIYYSDYEGILYTSHTIRPGPKVTFDEWKDENEKYPFESRLRINYKYQNDGLVQLVPSEDFTPIPWKMATQFDINFVYGTEIVQTEVNKLNNFLRNYVNKTKSIFKVFSGVKNTQWYWKLILEGEKGLLLVVTNPVFESIGGPCTDQCNAFGLEKLLREIPFLHCCKITAAVTETLNFKGVEEVKVGENSDWPEAIEFNWK